ncbi:uncharacterized protein LY79DRAFT_550796 [Colletotrichum navitas]|uniref:Secreted protein n=1 Tax=Colletotrichum navitas TaxID=681940 RepID=A0AAD8Q1R0_9PEZI|nr:uncharacterized protein LY79DRAFT_550796 [Colletotrichum navitas]KAK1593741.1 hypothetical protein LY79DRAFT_550796 [Colletotrichum navitas]
MLLLVGFISRILLISLSVKPYPIGTLQPLATSMTSLMRRCAIGLASGDELSQECVCREASVSSGSSKRPSRPPSPNAEPERWAPPGRRSCPPSVKKQTQSAVVARLLGWGRSCINLSAYPPTLYA